MFNNTVESLHKILLKILTQNLEKVEQPEQWKNKYSLELFGKRYLNLLLK